MSETLYDRDFYAWATEQASLLRAGRLSAADIATSPRKSTAWGEANGAN